MQIVNSERVLEGISAQSRRLPLPITSTLHVTETEAEAGAEGISWHILLGQLVYPRPETIMRRTQKIKIKGKPSTGRAVVNVSFLSLIEVELLHDAVIFPCMVIKYPIYFDKRVASPKRLWMQYWSPMIMLL